MSWFYDLSGTVNTVKINDTELLQQPTTIRWVSRPVLDVSGDGHGLYPLVRDVELRWNLLDLETSEQLQDFFDLVGTTGTCSITLPNRLDPGQNYHTFSGCVLYEPEWGEYYNGNPTNVILLVRNIRGYNA